MKFYGRKFKNISNLLFELLIFIFVIYIAITPLYFDQLSNISIFLLFFIMFFDFLMLQASIHRTVLLLQKKPLLEVNKEYIFHFSFFFPKKILVSRIESITEDAAAKKRFIYIKVKRDPKPSLFDQIIAPFLNQRMIDTTFVYGKYPDILAYFPKKNNH